MTCSIYEITGEYATDADSGQQVYDLIHAPLLAGQPVELDFTGVNVFASAFFNFAIAQLLSDLTSEDLNRLLTISHLTPDGYTVLKHSIDRAKLYYADAHYQDAVDSVIEEYAAHP
jgi:hypothetical protein